ncbi:unnamed protein product, partial [Notodromas monacha]
MRWRGLARLASSVGPSCPPCSRILVDGFQSMGMANVTGINVFDRQTKLLQRSRAALAPDADNYDYVKAEIGYRVADRLYDIKREMDIVVDLGCGRGHVSRHISADWVKKLVLTDHCPEWANTAVIDPEMPAELVSRLSLCEDKDAWPFEPNSVSCFLSSLSLHWVNDLPRCLGNIASSLRPDGVLICSVFGGETLYELRASLQLAELEREGGFAAHVSPFVRVEDLAGLLNKAGFTMLTLDSDEVVVRYPSMFEVMRDLQGMGESSATWTRKAHLHRETLMAAAAIYREMYGFPEEDGMPEGVPATFQILYAIGWKPDPSQPKPAARGTRLHRDFLNGRD